MPTDLQYRGFLIHPSHYDPNWIRRKSKEEHFDLRTGLKVVDAMAALGMNLLVIDIEDGDTFKSHPELRRRYSVSIADLERGLVKKCVNEIRRRPRYAGSRHELR